MQEFISLSQARELVAAHTQPLLPKPFPLARLAGLVAAMVIGDFQRVLEIGPEAGFFAAVDVGLYLTLMGAILAVAGSVLRLYTQLGRNGVAQELRSHA